MKIKRFKNLWLMGLILSACILGAIYILKIFLPHIVIKVAHLESIVAIGYYIDTHKWAWYLATLLLSFFAYYFYCGACCGKKKLNNTELLIILFTNLILFLVDNFFPAQYTVVNLCSMLFLPLIMGGKFKNTVIVFSAINILQTVTLEIRGISLMISHYNFATLLVIMIDYYILILLLYFMFNYNQNNDKRRE